MSDELRKIVEEIRGYKRSAWTPTLAKVGEWANRLQAEIERMEKAEPVAWLRYASDGTPIDALIGAEPIPFLHGRNAKLYTHPPADAGMVRVPSSVSGLLRGFSGTDQHDKKVPTVTVCFAYNDWDARDKFADTMIAAAEGKA